MNIRFLIYTCIFVLLSMQLYALRDHVQMRYMVTVQGTVSDSYGNPLPNAEVNLTNLSSLPVLTDANGFYRIQRGISGSGIIILRISKPGYKTMVKSNIIAHVEENLSFVFDCTMTEIP